MPVRLAILRETITLTDAQIKALPTTPIVLVPAPGAGRRIQFLQVTMSADFVAGAYTNISASGNIVLAMAGNERSSYIANDATSTPVLSEMTEFFDNSFKSVVLVPWMDTNDPTIVWGLISPAATGVDDVNDALELTCTNAAGDFTGGNAANTMTIRVYYVIEEFP